MEYNRGMEDIPFRELQARLIARIRHLIRNGESTERRMGKLVGISQPHIHHVLKGARNLTPPVFDLLLRQLGIAILDLYTGEELKEHLRRRDFTDTDLEPSEITGYDGRPPLRRP